MSKNVHYLGQPKTGLRVRSFALSVLDSDFRLLQVRDC